MRALLWVLLGIFVVVVAMRLIDPGEHGRTAVVVWVVAIVAYFALIYLVIVPLRVRRNFQQQKAMHFPISVEFADETFSAEAHNGNLRMKWEDFYKWKYDGKLILLYHTSRLYNLIPRRAFSSPGDYTIALAFLEQKLGRPRT